MNSYSGELSRITKIFLDPEDKYDELFQAADAYYKLLWTPWKKDFLSFSKESAKFSK